MRCRWWWRWHITHHLWGGGDDYRTLLSILTPSLPHLSTPPLYPFLTHPSYPLSYPPLIPPSHTTPFPPSSPPSLGRTEAVAKSHSTAAEAVTVAQNMRAHRLVLTHFSQRYTSVPAVPAEGRISYIIWLFQTYHLVISNSFSHIPCHVITYPRLSFTPVLINTHLSYFPPSLHSLSYFSTFDTPSHMIIISTHPLIYNLPTHPLLQCS